MARVRVTINLKACREETAHLPELRKELRRHANAGAARARAALAKHKIGPNSRGHSRIVVSSGTVDSFVSLDDTRGDQAAGIINIETGALGAAF